MPNPTDRHSASNARLRRIAQAAVAAGLCLSLGAAALAAEGQPPAPVFVEDFDVTAAVSIDGWTAVGTLARRPSPESELVATEYWVGRLPEEGVGMRAGRFMPAYGVHLADHTAFNRAFLELTQYDQVLGVEVSHARGATFTQVALSGGRADSLFDDDGRRSVEIDRRSVAGIDGVIAGPTLDGDLPVATGDDDAIISFAAIDGCHAWRPAHSKICAS